MAAAVEASGTAARDAWRLFWRVFMADKRRCWASLSDLGISPQQALAMGTLTTGEPMPMSALAEALHCDNSNITGIVDRLSERGLVERQAAEGDRRVKLVALTDAGRELRAELIRRRSIPPDEIAALPEADLRKMRAIFLRAVGETPER